jgi:exoribonuclease R
LSLPSSDGQCKLTEPDLQTDELTSSTSLHPFGTLVEELGPIGDADVETSALLKDCNFPTEEFNELAIKCLPPLPWS